jgi:hypothetical protein
VGFKQSRRQTQNLANGLHPLGRALGAPETSCGNCANAILRAQRRGATPGLKCGLSATGARKNLRNVSLDWPGCEVWRSRVVVIHRRSGTPAKGCEK